MAVSLYGRIDKEAWGSALPIRWDKVRDMFAYLNKTIWGYQLTFEGNVLANSLEPSIRCSLVRWESGSRNVGPKRDVILQTTDPKQMEAALFMLINEHEQELKNGKIQN